MVDQCIYERVWEPDYALARMVILRQPSEPQMHDCVLRESTFIACPSNCKRYFCMWSACTSCRPRTTSFHPSLTFSTAGKWQINREAGGLGLLCNYNNYVFLLYAETTTAWARMHCELSWEQQIHVNITWSDTGTRWDWEACRQNKSLSQSEALDRVSSHYRIPVDQYVVEAILIFLVAVLIVLVCKVLSLRWLLCFHNALLNMPKPMWHDIL